MCGDGRNQFASIGYGEVYPLWALSTVARGGLEWTTKQIGQVRYGSSFCVCAYVCKYCSYSLFTGHPSSSRSFLPSFLPIPAPAFFFFSRLLCRRCLSAATLPVRFRSVCVSVVLFALRSFGGPPHPTSLGGVVRIWSSLLIWGLTPPIPCGRSAARRAGALIIPSMTLGRFARSSFGVKTGWLRFWRASGGPLIVYRKRRAFGLWSEQGIEWGLRNRGVLVASLQFRCGVFVFVLPASASWLVLSRQQRVFRSNRSCLCAGWLC